MLKNMDSKFEHFKQPLREEHNELPPDFSWEEMKPAILGKMAAQPTAKRRWPLLFLLAIGLGGCLSYVAVQAYRQNTHSTAVGSRDTSTELVAAKTTKIAKQQPEKESESDSTTTLKPATTSESAPAAAVIRSGNRLEAAVLPASLADPFLALRLPAVALLPVQKPLSLSPSFRNSPLSLAATSALRGANDFYEYKAQPLDEKAIDSGVTTAKLPTKLLALLEDSVTIHYSAEISKLPTLPLSGFKLKTTPKLSQDRVVEVLQKEKSSRRLGLLMGTNSANEQAIALATPAVTAAEESRYAPFVQLHLELPLSAHFFTQAGIRWQQSNSFLQYSSSNSTTSLASDVVLLRSINISSNDTLERRGDTLLAAIEHRRLGQFNQRNLWQIPLAIGYCKNLGAWQIGLQAGVVFQFASQQKGLLPQSDGSLLSLQAAAEQRQGSHNLALHWQAALRLHYQLSKRWGLGVQSSFTKINQNWRPNTLMPQRPLLREQAIGLYWYF